MGGDGVSIETQMAELRATLAGFGQNFEQFLTEWRERERELPYWELIRTHRNHERLLRGEQGNNGIMGRMATLESKLDDVQRTVAEIDKRTKSTKLLPTAPSRIEHWWQDPRLQRAALWGIGAMLAAGYNLREVFEFIGRLLGV